jgi:hypothetical protein
MNFWHFCLPSIKRGQLGFVPALFEVLVEKSSTKIGGFSVFDCWENQEL